MGRVGRRGEVHAMRMQPGAYGGRADGQPVVNQLLVMVEGVDPRIIRRAGKRDIRERVAGAGDRHGGFLSQFEPHFPPQARALRKRSGMQIAQPPPDCNVVDEGRYVRAYVGPPHLDDIYACYHYITTLMLTHGYERVLVVGDSAHDPISHLAARDAVVALSKIGVPAGFRLALVPRAHEPL